MKINKVTITGADDKTDIKDLVVLTEKYPFVEWGILFSNSRGKQRYPSENWVKEVTKLNLPLSAHFCGWWARQVLEEGNYSLIEQAEGFSRIQLNYNFARSRGWKLKDLIEWAEESPKDIILQLNKSNKPIISDLEPPKAINFLYDASGGRGTVIGAIEPPMDGSYTGYAGGLSVENIDHICKLITESDDGEDTEVWIDLESGARTNDEFDLTKVEEILRISSKYINK